MVGLMCAGGFVCLTPRMRRLSLFGIATVTLLVVSWGVIESEAFNNGIDHQVAGGMSVSAGTMRDHTLGSRLGYFWPRAVLLFVKSPLFGTGFGSFNELEHSFAGVEGLAFFNATDAAFDGKGHVYVSIGGKHSYDRLHDLNTPYGKIHRVRDDGTVPQDNPFWVPENDRTESSTIHTVWSYGHRTGQGLDGHPITGEIWNTEMGPRGGDEVNLIAAGGNYGWPLYTFGLDYDGERVTIGEELGLNFPIESTVLPAVDLTPAPPVSNFTFHDGQAFTGWKHDLLIGTLKASTLYRMRFEDGKLVEQEKLRADFGRIRDVEMGGDGLVYVLLEHNETGSLWRLVPQ